ncbi:hypothetical protein HB847_14855 [Listeria booriae]|uniref:Uncharacterized protein n=1 Tax=Listeria booriae TaxID=1552123 RepID=A0A841Y9N3_9LIST|nr:hypothetical protein [Listeria booriae]MBC1373632.1 hypothetical protein [Listeria booriae]
MKRINNVTELERNMKVNGYWYSNVKKDLRVIVLAIANLGHIYVESMDRRKQTLSITTEHGSILCYLNKK